GWTGRHALLANLKPEIWELAGIVSKERRTNLGTILRDLTKPQTFVTCYIGRDALSPKGGEIFQETQKCLCLVNPIPSSFRLFGTGASWGWNPLFSHSILWRR